MTRFPDANLNAMALRWLLPRAVDDKLERVVQQLSREQWRELTGILVSQGLAAFWHKRLVETEIAGRAPADFLRLLHRFRFDSVGLYLLQQQGMGQLKKEFDQAGISHLLFKGCHIRERVYDDPALRPASDLDVLVCRAQRRQAIELLLSLGYCLYPKIENISHEVTLGKGRLYIDLHWDLLRPGRTREPLAEEFLQTRRDYVTHWGAGTEETLFLMLVHPVITKYLTTPQASLVRVLDLFWWIERVQVDWARVLAWLDRAGLRTAAWLALEWATRFGELSLPDDFRRGIAPGMARRRYLRYWIDNNLPGRLLGYPLIIQVGFTLPVHDHVSDAWRVVKQARMAKRHARREMEALMPDEKT